MDREIFLKQIRFKPEIKNYNDLSFDNVVIGGMGGSALPARALFFLDPTFPAWLHNGFGLPQKMEGKTLCIAISYSGNTRETISFAKEAMKKGVPLAVITSGGALLEMAEEKGLPHIVIPGATQPRDCVIYMLKSLLVFLGKEQMIKQIEDIDISKITHNAEDMARSLNGNIPIIYSSDPNQVLGYIWKISFNENAKVPAWNNTFPELTHNEIQGMIPSMNGGLTKNIKILMLMDDEDREEDKLFMKAFKDEIGGSLEMIDISLPQGKTDKLIAVLVMARETSHALARLRDVVPENVEIIEAFKKRLKI